MVTKPGNQPPSTCFLLVRWWVLGLTLHFSLKLIDTIGTISGDLRHPYSSKLANANVIFISCQLKASEERQLYELRCTSLSAFCVPFPSPSLLSKSSPFRYFFNTFLWPLIRFLLLFLLLSLHLKYLATFFGVAYTSTNESYTWTSI